MTLQDPPSGEITRAQTNLAILRRLAELDDQDQLTDDDRDLFGQWSGWGPMAKAFETRDGTWGEIADEVPDLISPAARETAFAATPTAFYTSSQVIDAAWTLAEGIGFGGGRALEPGCGSGRFMAGAPEGTEVRWTGVEFDLTSARIAELLHPEASIVTRRLEDLTLTDRSYDLVIGNVPFSDVKPHDRVHASHGLSLHNYFLWRSLMAVKPGGYVIAVTSRFTLDAEGAKQRGALGEFADLVGAIRLPAGAFKSCGTDVVTDLLVLRRRDPDEGYGDCAWHETGSVQTDTRRWSQINRYYIDHPEQVLGTLSTKNGQYGKDDLTVVATETFEDDLDMAIGRIVVNSRRFRLMDKPEPEQVADPFDVDAEGRKEASFHITGPQSISQVQLGQLVPVRYSAELEALIRLRDACLDVLAGESDFDAPDAKIAFNRMVLNDLYDAYVNNPKWGPLNRCTIVDRGVDPDTGMPRLSRRRPAMGGFRQDPDYVTVLSFEDYDDDTHLARKGPIFERRINKKPATVDSVDNIGDAIAVSLDRHGHISLPTIAGLLDMPLDRVAGRLAEIAFEDPAKPGSQWVPADEYLSGNVREKLVLAKAAVHDDPKRYHRNVSELTKIIPEDLRPEEISVRLGAPWIPATDLVDFIAEVVLDDPSKADEVEVIHNKVVASWDVNVTAWSRQSSAATVTWGTSRIDAFDLIELACNGKAPEIRDKIPGTKGKTVKNVDETLLASDKMSELSERFGDWIWEDPDRTERLCRYYNDHFNSVVLRHYDGSHLTFPGMRDGFNPYQSQLDMVYRSICLEAAGCGHIVGAGKTSIMAMTAMKMRDLGLVNKPMTIVPNHLLEQVAREIKALFPLRRILMVTKDDLSKERRKRFAAKVATGDWDLVVMTHTGFGAMPVSGDVEASYLRHDLERWEQSLRDSVSENGKTSSGKQLAKRVEQRRARLNELLDRPYDDGVGFEQLGVDYLLVDEAHYFKNLGTPGSCGVSNPSKRAENLHVKLWYLRNLAPGTRVCTLYSGTLISNSLAEMFVVQTYLQPDELRKEGIDQVDAWAGLHVEYETKIEVSPDGKSFRLYRRPSKFQNVPELRRMFAMVVDVRTKGDLALPGPEVVSENIVIPPSPELEAYVDWLVQRADATRNSGGGIYPEPPENDNMLLICTDGRKAALDLELVGVRPGSDRGKVGTVAENVAAVWRDHRDAAYTEVGSTDLSPALGALQIVFCDLGTPNKDKGAQVYGKIKDDLVAQGMDPDRIRFIHEANNDTAKTMLFNDCRNGKVDVLFGSTDKLGVGTNIQHRDVAIHHVDAPWRPSDVEQRVGRGDRPGNQNEKLFVYRYVREGSFDSFMWQALERKARFIAQVLTGDLAAREVPDIGDITLSYTEVKALATGNPLLLEAAEAQAEATRLRRHLKAHLRDQRATEQAIAWNIAEAERLEADGQARLALAEKIGSSSAYKPRLSGEEFTDQNEVGRLIGTKINEARDRCERPGKVQHRVGTWGGAVLQVDVRNNYMKWEINLSVMGTDGQWMRLCEIQPLWLKDGQWYRVGSAVAAAIGELPHRGDSLLMDALRRRTRADDSRAALKAFPQAAELAAAEAWVQRIEDAIAAEVNKDERERSNHAAEVYAAEAAEADA